MGIKFPNAVEDKNWKSGAWSETASPYRSHCNGVNFELHCYNESCPARTWAKENNRPNSDSYARVICQGGQSGTFDVFDNRRCPGCSEVCGTRNIYLNNVTATIKGKVWNEEKNLFEVKELTKTVGDTPSWCDVENKAEFANLFVSA